MYTFQAFERKKKIYKMKKKKSFCKFAMDDDHHQFNDCIRL